jgi:hypothetical protein
MTADACIPNIGSRGQQQRRRFGVVALVIAVAMVGVFLVLDVERLWRLSVFLPLLLGGTGVFQAREKT